jgi:hypothetical protein
MLLAKGLPQLQQLLICRCGVTSEGLLAVSDNLASLTHLNIGTAATTFRGQQENQKRSNRRYGLPTPRAYVPQYQ